MSDRNKNRGDLSQDLEIARREFDRKKDPQTRFQYGKLVYQSGEFAEARMLLAPFRTLDSTAVDAIDLLAEIEYLLGNYREADVLLLRIREHNSRDLMQKIMTELKLVYVYYQLNQYQETFSFFKGQKVNLPLWELMKAFGTRKPYLVEWKNSAHRTEALFRILDPLPVIEVSVNGKKVLVLIDTGADMLILDREVAHQLGIKQVATTEETFAGGKKNTVSYAIADSLALGDVHIRDLPIMVMQTEHWAKVFAESGLSIDGVLGTQVLKQFLSTIDYQGKKLILRKRDEETRQSFYRELAGNNPVKVPFAMALSHMMIVSQGTINRKSNLTFFMDSGLAAEGAAFCAPGQTLRYLDIFVPDKKEKGLGGSEQEFDFGLFDIRELGIGNLEAVATKGVFGIMPDDWYWGFGELGGGTHSFIVDGLISHDFLKTYAWTIDFDGMEMFFSRE